MIAPARRAAFRALLAVAGQRQDSASALADRRRWLTDPRDVALAGELVTGVLRWQAALDASLQPLVARDLSRLDPEVRLALRLGAYQRLFLTRIPAAAAVNDSVSLVREAGRASAAGLVNAVLRRLEPDRARSGWPPRPAEPAAPSESAVPLAYLSTTLSHPAWLVSRWMTRHGFDGAERWALFDNAAAPLTLRPVTWRVSREALAARLAADGVTTAPARWAPDALLVTDGHALHTRAAAEGLFVAQDEASQLVAQLAIDVMSGRHVTGHAHRPRVLDTCASPGGKTVAIRGGLGEHGAIVACDLRPRRVALLRDTLSRVGAGDVLIARADALRPLPFGPTFDLVVLDAPCSGLGTIRREPEIRWRRVEADLERFARDQRTMLDNAAAAVRPGGVLLYATCSSEPEEDEAVVQAFLGATGSFRRLDAGKHPWAGSVLAALLDDHGDLRTLPHRHGLEAFYAAVLQSCDRWR